MEVPHLLHLRLEYLYVRLRGRTARPLLVPFLRQIDFQLGSLLLCGTSKLLHVFQSAIIGISNGTRPRIGEIITGASVRGVEGHLRL